MEIAADGWLANIFNCPVFRIETSAPLAPNPGRAHPAISELIRDHIPSGGPSFCYAKVETQHVQLVKDLSSAGLYVVDVNVTFSIDVNKSDQHRDLKTSNVLIREIEPPDYEVTLETAATCFRYSRFHLDPLVSTPIANLIKREWISNYIRHKRGEQLFVAIKGASPVGFLAVMASASNGQRQYAIDLIGVADDYQGQGIGRALTAFFIDRYKDRCDSLQVGTQAANIASMRLYQKLGFYIGKTQYVMHGHFAGV